MSKFRIRFLRRAIVPLATILLVLFLFSQVDAKEKKAPKDADVIVYITDTGKKYHREDCRSLWHSKIKITLKEAKERGYTPCKVCKPPQISEDPIQQNHGLQ